MSDTITLSAKKDCMPADENPTPPSFEVPENACDAHCHIFGPHDIFPYHESSSYHPPDAGKDKLRALHDFLGIKRAVIVQASCHGPDNRAMLDAIADNPKNYRGVCLASREFTEDDFAKLNQQGVKGIRYNFVKHLGGAPDIDEMLETVEKVKPLGWHLVLHVNGEDLITYCDVFVKIDMQIVIDHMGRIPIDKGIDGRAFGILCDFMAMSHWWVKICGAERISIKGPPFHDAIPYAQRLIEIAEDRILWGTDYPHPNIKTHMPNDGDLLNLVPLIAKDKKLIRKILVDNPARLYGFEEGANETDSR